MTKKIIKSFVIVMIIAMGALIMSGCDNAEKRAALEDAKQNAIDYIKEKYGFTAKVTDAENLPGSEMFGYATLSDMAWVYMNYNGRDFIAWVPLEKGSTVGALDNYQVADVEDAIKVLVTKEIGRKPDKVKLCSSYGDSSYRNKANPCFLSGKYTGDNLSDVLTFISSVYVGYSGYDYTKLPNSISFMNELDSSRNGYVDVHFLFFDSTVSMNKYFEFTRYKSDYLGIYIKNRVRYYKGIKKDEFKYTVGSENGIYYSLENGENVKVSITKTSTEVGSYWSIHGSKDFNYLLDGSYTVTLDDDTYKGTVVFYIPKTMLKNYKSNEEVHIAFKGAYNNEINSNSEYYIFTENAYNIRKLNGGQETFTLIQAKK